MKIFLIILAFLFGFYICLNYSNKNVMEYFQNNNNKKKCPNILIQKGNVLWLYNKDEKIVPGVNPIVFENLSEYVKYVEWEQQNNRHCPVLYFQEVETTQGKRELRNFPNYLNKKGGLPSFNKMIYTPESNDYKPLIRKTSDFYSLDKIYNENADETENAMDSNWIGGEKSRKNIERAKFAEVYENQINMKDKNKKKEFTIGLDNMDKKTIQEHQGAARIAKRNKFDSKLLTL